MSGSFLSDFHDNTAYSRLKATQVYLFTFSTLRREKAWSKDACEDLAYDLTMEAITGLLMKEKAGQKIENPYAYLMATVKNYLRHPKLIWEISTNRQKLSVEDNQHQKVNFGKRKWEIQDVDTMIVMPSENSLSVFSMKLTDVEEQVVKLLDEGYNGKEIAEKLGKSETFISRSIKMIRLKTKR